MDADRQRLREMVLEGMSSPATVVADARYFAKLRKRVLEFAERPKQG